MSIIVPIVIVSLVVGIFAKKMTFPLWMVMGLVILATLTRFYMKH